MQAQEVVLQRSTYEAYTIYVGRHLIPYFDSIGAELETLTPMQVQRYATMKTKSGRMDGKDGGLSMISVKKHISVLKQALTDAIHYGYITSNPASYVRLPRKKSGITERSVLLTAEEAQRVIDAFCGHRLYIAVVLSLYYGLRRSEVLGLKWSAIDFEKNTLSICHTVVKNLTIEAKDSTKTATSRRTFQLIPEVRKMLLEQKSKSAFPSDYIMTWDDGRLMRPDYLTSAFEKQLKRANLPKMRFHDLRHSTASILFDKGWQMEDIKNWLGHSDIETTSNIYLHYGRTRKIMLANDLSGLLSLGAKV